MHEPMGSDEIHLRVLRELAYKTLFTMFENSWQCKFPVTEKGETRSHF